MSRLGVRFAHVCVATAPLVTPIAACAQNDSDSQWNHFGLDLRVGFNIKAKFSNLGAAAAQAAPSSSGGVDHTYSDGFVRLDSSGDRGGSTWNWGYQNASQITGNGTVTMHVGAAEGATSAAKDDPRLGFEANYARDLGHFSSGRWGLKLGLGFTDVTIHDNEVLNGNVGLITDAYPLRDITPPLAPYAGSFSGPGPVIGDTPTRTMTSIAGGALITGRRQLDIWFYDLHFGPYLELPLVNRVTFEIGAGIAGGLVDSTFSFSEATSASGTLTQASGSSQRSDALAGFYGEAGLTWRILAKTSLFAGGQFESLGKFNQNAADRSAQLDLRRTLYLVVGIQWHF